MGELHLEVLVDRMMREFKVEANVGKPQVAYRETITETVEKVEMKYVRQTGGKGQYGHVVITLEPTGPGGGYEFVDKITGGVDPEGVHPVGRRRYPGGHCSPASSPATRWSTCAPSSPSARTTTSTRRKWRSRSPVRWRSRRRPSKAKPVLLEPIFAIEVVTPDDYMGEVIGDLNSRRGRVEGTEQRGNAVVVKAQVPLAEMFGYVTDLRSKTQGRASSTHAVPLVPAGSAEHRHRNRRPCPWRIVFTGPLTVQF